MRKAKWLVYGEYPFEFTNLKDAKAYAKEYTSLNNTTTEVWLIEEGCWYLKYENGKCIYDGWTIKK